MSEEVNLDLVVVWVGVCASVANAMMPAKVCFWWLEEKWRY